jgi:hypothetical protein
MLRVRLPFLVPPGTALILALIEACSPSPDPLASSAASAGGASMPGGGGTSVTGGGGASGASTAALASGVSVASGGDLPDRFTVSGVVTDGHAPIAGAIVMQGGGEPLFTTGPDGVFSVEVTRAIPGIVTVVAAKIGYRAAGLELMNLPGGPIEIELALSLVTGPDNPSYVYGAPGEGSATADNSTKVCGHCHTTMVKQFLASAHARSARDPRVQDLYAGVASAVTTEAACAARGGEWRVGLKPGTAASAAPRCYLGAGVLPDLNPGCGAVGQLSCDDPARAPEARPTTFGRCADCHAPGIDGVAGGRSLLEAVGIAFENGNHCDVCHHVRDVDLTRPPGVAGALVLQRPRDHRNDLPGAPLVQVMYGPLPDVPMQFMGGSYQPLFATSTLCGGCHEQKQEALLPGSSLEAARWRSGLPTHSTYSEWAESAYNKPISQCQACHMPPDEGGLKNSLDVTDETTASITYGFIRPPEQTRQHTFRGPLAGAPRLIDGSVTLGLAAAVTGGELTVTAKLQNKTAGHAIPTGEPMRALLLVVRADACGAPMAPSSGMTLDDWGGAIAEGLYQPPVSASGAVLSWPLGAARAKVGDVVRAVRMTGAYDDYPGIGFFANPALSPAEKGIAVLSPVGEATVTAVAPGALTLSRALPFQPGDRLYLGDALPAPPSNMGDGALSAALAGSAGKSFARTLVDPVGRRGAPHFRAVDMVSDNRLAPGVSVTSAHGFSLPSGCKQAVVSATVIYRPLPFGLARERGWEARDYVVSTTTQSVTLP